VGRHTLQALTSPLPKLICRSALATQPKSPLLNAGDNAGIQEHEGVSGHTSPKLEEGSTDAEADTPAITPAISAASPTASSQTEKVITPFHNPE
jgi:hypothetical protein